jgi:hypothetical protein
VSNKNYLEGKKDLAQDILEKIEKGYGKEDILDLIKVWAGKEDE